MNQVENTYSQIILGTLAKNNTLLLFPSYIDLNPIISLLLKFYKETVSNKKIGLILNKTASFQILHDFIETHKKTFVISEFKSSQSLEFRKQKYEESEVIVITPKLLRNDILRQIISPDSFSFLFFTDAKLVKGKHSSAQLMEIIQQNSIHVRIAGLVQESIQSLEELEQICENLLITKIEYIEEKEQVSSLYKNPEEKVTIPINKQMYDFCFEVNRYIKEYQAFLKTKGVEKPLSVRKEFPSFVTSLRVRYDFDEQQILIRKAIELMNFVTIKELVETSGTKAALGYMDKLKKREQDESEEKLSNLTTKFARTPVFEEIYSEVAKLSETTSHPKLERLKQIIPDLKSKTGFTQIYVVTNHKTVLPELSDIIKDLGLKSKHLPRSQTKERSKTLELFNNGEIDVLLATHYLKTKADAVIFFNVPTKYEWYKESKKYSKKVFFFVTHRSQEERVYHKFKNREKSVGRIINHTKIQERLIQNQQILFEKSIEEKMSSRTKAFVNLAKTLSKSREGRAEKTTYSENLPKNIASVEHIQFLANCSYSEAQQISSLIASKNLKSIENLSIDVIAEIFPRSRAIEIIETIEGRKYGISD